VVRPQRIQAGADGRKEKGPRRGFTLVELIVVIVVLLLLAGVAVPSFFRFQHAARFQGVVQRAVGLMGVARGLAISTEHDVVLLWDEETRSLRVQVEPADADRDLEPNAPAPPASERSPRDLRVLPMPPEVDARVEVDTRNPDPALRFYPDGRAEPGVLRLEREGAAPVLLTVNPRTGRVRAAEMEP
jgi:prepilin-type N-terminal cleavage/methylation domain-containing protein